MFTDLLVREISINLRRKGDWATIGVFFIMLVSLFPLSSMSAVADKAAASLIAPGIVWIAALLAIMLSLDRQFRSDYQQGVFDQMVISSQPLAKLALGKICAHWLLIGLPLIILSPLIGVLLQLATADWLIIMTTLLLGAPALSALGSIAAVLTVGLPNGGMLMALLLLPLYMPVLIFATSAIAGFQQALPYAGQLAMLAAIAIASMMLAPFAVAQGIKVSVMQ